MTTTPQNDTRRVFAGDIDIDAALMNAAAQGNGNIAQAAQDAGITTQEAHHRLRTFSNQTKTYRKSVMKRTRTI